MKRFIAIFAAAAMLLVMFAGCSGAGFKDDGTFTVKTEKGSKRTYQLVEIAKEEGKVRVFVRGNEENYVCAYAFGLSGFDWQVNIGASAVCGGEEINPSEIIPYLSSEKGNTVEFVFETETEPEIINIFAEGYPKGGAKIETEKLSLDPALYVSENIVALQ